jgi:hypothetical protein
VSLEDDKWKPNLFVPGFSKCGTTALCDYLSQHPDIYVIEGKEPRGLTEGTWQPSWDVRYDQLEVMTFKKYKAYYKNHENSAYRVDGSQNYTYATSYARKIKDFSPKAKVVMMVRDQVQRLVSNFYYLYTFHREPNFSAWVNKFFIRDLSNFLFYKHIISYTQSFGAQNILVITNDSLKRSPRNVMSRVFGFLDLDDFQVTSVSSNTGQFKALNEEERREFARSFAISNALEAPARFVLNNSGQFGYMLKFKLSRISPVHRTRQKFTNLSAKNESHAELEKIHLPSEIECALSEDYRETLQYCKAHGILLD